MHYREGLDKLNCCFGHGADGLWIHAKCHFPSLPGARYRDGVLTFYCSVCNKVVCEIAIASKKK